MKHAVNNIQVVYKISNQDLTNPNLGDGVTGGEGGGNFTPAVGFPLITQKQ